MVEERQVWHGGMKNLAKTELSMCETGLRVLINKNFPSNHNKFDTLGNKKRLLSNYFVISSLVNEANDVPVTCKI